MFYSQWSTVYTRTHSSLIRIRYTIYDILFESNKEEQTMLYYLLYLLFAVDTYQRCNCTKFCSSTIYRVESRVLYSMVVSNLFIKYFRTERTTHHFARRYYQCLRLKLFVPNFSACTSMPLDVPNVETRTSNLLSRLIACAISRAPSIVDSLNLQYAVKLK